MEDAGHRLRRPLHRRIQRLLLLRLGLTQDVLGDDERVGDRLPFGRARSADADAQAGEVLALDGVNDVAQAVVAAVAAARPQADVPHRQLEVIADDEHLLRRQFVALEKAGRRIAAAVDEGSGLGQHQGLVVYLPLAYPGRAGALEADVPVAGQSPDAPEAHVVTMGRVGLAGVA